MAKYSYPRVDISTKALKHSSIAPGGEDTTVLFMPLKTEKGPDYQVTPVHSLSEFVQTFGSLEYVYAENGQAALNVNNWLINGGTLYICRLPAGEKLSFDFVKSGDKYLDGLGNEYTATYNSEEVQTLKTLATLSIGTGTDAKTYTVTHNTDGDITEVSRTVNDVKEYLNYHHSRKATADIIDLVGFSLAFEAAYNGNYYNGIKIQLESLGKRSFNTENPIFNISVIKGALTLERFYRVTKDNIVSILNGSNGSNYIKVTVITENSTQKSNDTIDFKEVELTGAIEDTKYFYKKGNEPYEIKNTTEALLRLFWGEKLYDINGVEVVSTTAGKVLGNRLETPIDLILDAGYAPAIKNLMWDFVNPGADSEDSRPDIVLILDSYYKSSDGTMLNARDEGEFPFGTNVAVYDQYFKVNCIFEDGKEIDVTPSYFLSKLIAYNDNQYGVQWATAGIRRGILDDVTWINKNPYPSEKQKLFEDRINYVEKTSREYAFMSQRTHDGSSDAAYTALSFLNNVRALYKMQRELERLGRDYLYEFNDSVTLANLSNVLNRYMTQWVSNRTLASAVVDVKKSSYSDEAVDITMTIRFTGTIEVISIDITIE